MPTPVLEIPVDDTEFKAFIATFQKYQEQLKQQPEAWRGVNDGISESKASAEQFASSMGVLVEAVNKLTAAEDHRESKRQQSEELKKRDAERKRREEQEEGDRQRSVVNRVREYSRSVGDAVKSVGGGLGGMAEHAVGGITGGAGGIFGVIGGALRSIPMIGGALGGLAMAAYETMHITSGTMRQAHGLGIDTGTLQAWKTSKLAANLPDGSIENLLNTVAEAKASPGGGGILGGRFKIKDYQNKNVSEISGEMLKQAQAFLKQNPGDRGMWAAQGRFGNVLDTATLNSLKTLTPKQLDQYLEEMKKFAKDNANADANAVKNANNLADAEALAVTGMNKFDDGMNMVIDELKKFFVILQHSNEANKVWDKAADIASGAAFDRGLGMLRGIPGQVGAQAMDNARNDAAVISNGYNTAKNYITGIGHTLASIIGMGGTSKADVNNNPGNVMNHGRYIRYPSREAGFSAMAQQIQIDYNKHGAHSIAALINGPDHPWASEHAPGNSHASTMAYISKVSRAVGVGANQNINMNDSGILVKIAKAMYEFESGHKSRMPGSDTGHTAKAVEHAVKKGTMQAHRATGHALIMVRTQQKPGSDVTVSARQLAAV